MYIKLECSQRLSTYGVRLFTAVVSFFFFSPEEFVLATHLTCWLTLWPNWLWPCCSQPPGGSLKPHMKPRRNVMKTHRDMLKSSVAEGWIYSCVSLTQWWLGHMEDIVALWAWACQQHCGHPGPGKDWWGKTAHGIAHLNSVISWCSYLRSLCSQVLPLQSV